MFFIEAPAQEISCRFSISIEDALSDGPCGGQAHQRIGIGERPAKYSERGRLF